MAPSSSIIYKLSRRLGLVNALARAQRGRISQMGCGNRTKAVDLNSMIADHFATYSDSKHPCRGTLTMALELLSNRSAVIVETGSSAWGTNSTLLLDAYCNSFGGSCHSVDIRVDPLLKLRSQVSSRTKLYCDDSVSFLKKLKMSDNKIDLLYLDSWDVDWSDPVPSAIHGLNEYLTAVPNLHSGSLVLIDDTPKDHESMARVQPHSIKAFSEFKQQYGFAPGKGALVKKLIESTGMGTILAHDYQLLIQI